MRYELGVLMAAAVVGATATPARTWWDAGHMQIAYVAYNQLDPAVKERADQLLRLNDDYPNWSSGAPHDKTAKAYAFVHA